MDDNKYINYFLDIDNLSKGQKAALKRSVGKTIGESKGEAIVSFYQVFPKAESSFGQEEKWFLTATLYAGYKTRLNQEDMKKPWHETDLGWTLRGVSTVKGSSGIEKRFTALLDCREYNESMAYKLRQLLTMADSRQIPVNWPGFLNDLLYWEHPERFVQKKWARNYFNESEEKR